MRVSPRSERLQSQNSRPFQKTRVLKIVLLLLALGGLVVAGYFGWQALGSNQNPKELRCVVIPMNSDCPDSIVSRFTEIREKGSALSSEAVIQLYRAQRRSFFPYSLESYTRTPLEDRTEWIRLEVLARVETDQATGLILEDGSLWLSDLDEGLLDQPVRVMLGSQIVSATTMLDPTMLSVLQELVRNKTLFPTALLIIEYKDRLEIVVESDLRILLSSDDLSRQLEVLRELRRQETVLVGVRELDLRFRDPVLR